MFKLDQHILGTHIAHFLDTRSLLSPGAPSGPAPPSHQHCNVQTATAAASSSAELNHSW